MNRPEKKSVGPYYDYNEVIDFIEHKYKIETRGYTPKCGFKEEYLKKPHLDFWHWIINNEEIHNGGKFYLNLTGDNAADPDWDGDDEYRPRWVREIQKMIYDEFCVNEIDSEEGLTLWIEW